ncbi:DUF1654 domain-containing protein, partial [Pseudomonas sp. FIP_A4]|uniref:DUF1654 domain-containing protein n=1 Tax=Pseudomonas sp. FIP_A4 TaxID=3070684 RepID=UPI003FA6DF2A
VHPTTGEVYVTLTNNDGRGDKQPTDKANPRPHNLHGHAQRECQANLATQQDDRPEDWERLLDEIQQTDGFAMTKRSDGSVHVRWRTAAR